MAIDTVSGTTTEKIDQLTAGQAEVKAENRDLRSSLRVIVWILALAAPLLVALGAFLVHQTYTLMGDIRVVDNRLGSIEKLLQKHDDQLQKQGDQLHKLSEQLIKQGEQLIKQGEQLQKQGEQLQKQGEQLARIEAKVTKP